MGFVFQTFGKRLRDDRNIVPHGVIPATATLERRAGSVSQDDLDNPPPGVFYQIQDDGTIIETRRLLPASRIWLEIRYAIFFGHGQAASPIVLPGLAGGLLGTMFALPNFTVRTVNNTTVFQLCEGEMVVNQPITITQEMIDNGREFEDIDANRVETGKVTVQTAIIDLGVRPISVYGVVKERIVLDPYLGEIKEGIKFEDEELETLGRGMGVTKLGGTTGQRGQFGKGFDYSSQYDTKWINVKYEPFEKIHSLEPSLDTPSDAVGPPSRNLFVQIRRDPRIYKFRADNDDVKSFRTALAGDIKRYFPPGIQERNDVTSTKIEVKTNEKDFELEPGSVIYITMSVVTNRYVRQVIYHTANVFFPDTIQVLAQGQNVLGWGYQLREWRVPKEDLDNPAPDNITDKDYDWIISRDTYETDTSELTIDEYPYDTIEGWRISEALIDRDDWICWAADDRGILMIQKRNAPDIEFIWPGHTDFQVQSVYTVVPKEDIRDQDWFTNYLREIKQELFIPDLVEQIAAATPADRTIEEDILNEILDAYQLVEIEKYLTFETSGWLFELSMSTNSYLLDREKVFYHRPFALALQSVTKYDMDDEEEQTGIGFPLLDLYRYDIVDGSADLEDLQIYDLSNADFEVMDINSTDPGVYGGSPDGQMFAPWAFYSLTPPQMFGTFGTRTRVYLERINSWQGYGGIYMLSTLDAGSISYGANLKIDTSIVAFEDTVLSNSVAFHTLSYGNFDEYMIKLNYSFSRSHFKDPFTYDRYRLIGYDRIIGTQPSYSSGKPITDVYTRICNNQATFDDVFIRVPASEIDISVVPNVEPKKFTLPQNDLIEAIDFTITPDEEILGDKDDISLYLTDSDLAVNNFTISGKAVEKRKHAINMALYPGKTIELGGTYWDKVDVSSIEAITTTNAKIQPFKAVGRQVSSIVTNEGRMYVFFADDTRGNISVAASGNYGIHWVIYNSLIKLVKGEIATSPMAIKDTSTSQIHLFFILNNAYLMYKLFDPRKLICGDSFSEYERPDIYDPFVEKDSTNDQLRVYTNSGRSLRDESSWFMHGDAEGTFFKKEMEVVKEIEDYNKDNQTEIIQPRFGFGGTIEADGSIPEMDRPFGEQSYSIYKDSSGTFRLLWTENGKLSIKIAIRMREWRYLVKNFAHFHKNFLPQDEKTELVISNLRVIYDPAMAGRVILIYFHDNQMFIRHFKNDVMELPGYKFEFNVDLVNELTVTKESGNKPIFVVGDMDNRLLAEKQRIDQEVDRGVRRQESEAESDMVVVIPYTTEQSLTFDNTMAINPTIQPDGYLTKKGQLRIFYKDSSGFLQALTMGDLRTAYLDCRFALTQD